MSSAGVLAASCPPPHIPSLPPPHLARYAEPRLQQLLMLNTIGKHKGKEAAGSLDVMAAGVTEMENQGTMDMLIGWADKMEGGSAVEMIKYGVSSLSLLTETSMKMVAHVEKGPAHLHTVKSALNKATEIGKMAALSLKRAIASSLSQFTTLSTLMNHIKKQQKCSCMWWFFQMHQALEELKRSVDSNLTCLEHTSASVILKDFDAAIAAYAVVIKLCKKHSNHGSSMLQGACIAAVAILSCVRIGVVALQVFSSSDTTTMSYNIVSNLADADVAAGGPGLKKLISTLNNKRRNLMSITEANKRLLQETQKEMKILQSDSKKIKLSLEALKIDLNFCPMFIELVKSMRSFNVLLEPYMYKRLQKYHNDLLSLQESCDQLIENTQRVYDSFKNESSTILTKSTYK